MQLLIPLPGAEDFTAKVAASGGFEVGELEFRRFPDGERYVRVQVNPSGRPVAIVCPNVDDHFLTLAFVADTLRDLGAGEVTLIAPYLGYMRQDARFQPGEAITARTFARLVSSVVDRLVTVDPHLHRFGSLEELYSIPCSVLHAAPLLGEWIARNVVHPLIIGPDAESEQWASEVAAIAEAPYAVLSKIRRGDRQVEIVAPDLRHHRELRPVLIDDVASSGRTLIAAGAVLRAQGFCAPVCAVVHAMFGGDGFAATSASVGRLISTDTVAHASNAITVTTLIAEALGGQAPAPP